MSKILVVEDDPKIARLLVSDLELEGHRVEHAADGAAGYEKARRWKPDLNFEQARVYHSVLPEVEKRLNAGEESAVHSS